MCFEFILHNSHLKLEWEAGYLLAVLQNSKVSNLSRVLSAGSFCPLDQKKDFFFFLIEKLESPVNGLDENTAPMPVCWHPDTASPFLCEAGAASVSAINPHPSVGTPKDMHLQTSYLKKK